MTTETDAPGGARGLRPEWLLERDGMRSVRSAGCWPWRTRGLKRITTALVQAPAAANGHIAIAAAEVETTQGGFTGPGEAAPGTGGPQMVTVLPASRRRGRRPKPWPTP